MSTKEEREKEKRESILLKAKGTTGEPLVTEKNYSVDLPLALNWHSAHTDVKKKREWFKAYLLHTNSQYASKSLSDVGDYMFTQAGVFCHIILIGGYISPKHKKWLDDKILEIVNYKKPLSMAIDGVENQKVIPKATREKYLDNCVEIDKAIDDFIINKTTSFSMKGFIALHNIASSAANKISSYYTNFKKELEEALEGKDEQLVEGYSCYSRSDLKKFHGLLSDIVDGAAQAKVSRAPRTKKEKPLSVIVKDVQYTKEFPELSMVSVDVKTLHNSKEIWMYNTVSRRLFVYKADSGSTLIIKGKYIKNFSVKESSNKVVRKPEEFFKNYVLGKAVMASTYKDIKAVAGKVNGKIYPENILLKVF